MTKFKTLLGPGYYNPMHESQDRLPPSFSFERGENTLAFDPKVLAEYANETDQIKLDKNDRLRDFTNS